MNNPVTVTDASTATDARGPRTLMFSQRNIFPSNLYRCPLYEFENVICQIDSVDVLAPQMDASSRRHDIARNVAFHVPVTLNPGLPKTEIKGSYDLFFAICGAPGDLLMLNAVSNWKEACKTSICLLDEFWVKEMSDYQYFLPILKRFDAVMLYYSQSVEALRERIGRECVYLPPATDATLFCPYPELPKRVVDVYSIGRRSATTHQALLKMSQEQGIFYLHDTIAGDKAINSKEHRALLAHVAKRSRYYIVNPGLIDRPDKRGTQIEIGNRYFEGAMSGAVMIGERPDNEEFERQFDWPDAVIHLPYGSGNIDTIINDLDRQPDRQDQIRRTNVSNALKRHDWVYRWEAVLKTAGLAPMPALLERKERLKHLANGVL